MNILQWEKEFVFEMYLEKQDLTNLAPLHATGQAVRWQLHVSKWVVKLAYQPEQVHYPVIY